MRFGGLGMANSKSGDYNLFSPGYTGGELRNGMNGFLTSYATDSVRFSQQILDI